MLSDLQLTKQILVLPKENCLFFLNSKCASSSIRRMAMFKLGYSDLFYFRDLDLLNTTPIDRWFLIVRNPFDRIASLWLDKTQRTFFKGFANIPGMRRGMKFKTFIRAVSNIKDWALVDSHFWPQSLIANVWLDKLKIIKIEDLSNGWPDDLPLPKHDNKAKEKVDYNGLWDKETKHLIMDQYWSDFEVLPYAYH